MTPLEILKKYFGYETFRPNQEQIINTVVDGRDTFVLMPTGGGKSLCYQVPALIREGLTIVISPLIALMKDQVDALRMNGIEAAYLNSSQSLEDQERILRSARENKLKILYLAPERIMSFERGIPFIEKLAAFNVSLVAIDEAHCISQWGHDFRPDYRHLAQLKKKLNNVPVIALTATADKHTQKDILEKLELRDPSIFVSSFNRANIRYLVEEKYNSFDRLINFLKERKDESGIIYCLSRRSTEILAEDLQHAGYKALAYHAGMEPQQRNRHQDLFLRDEVKIMVATIAFGMGIDKSNVRFVIHMDVPKNIEGYYQETGRAGRDGLDSMALLFYSAGDIVKMKKFVTIENNPEQTEIGLKKLDEMARYGTLTRCRRKYLLNYFDEQAPDFCGNCDVCLASSEKFDATPDALKILTAVRDLNEKFGAGYVVDLLWGSTGNRVQPDHKLLMSYGLGNNRTKLEWNHLLAQMTSLGYLYKTSGMYPILKITEKGFRAMERKETIFLFRAITASESLQLSQPVTTYSTELMRQLKDSRRTIAAKEGVPAYVVLSDATLVELATYLPLDSQSLIQIHGFGEVKIKKYGSEFISVLNKFCTENKLSSLMHTKESKTVKRDSTKRDSTTRQLTLKLFLEGNDAHKIAEIRNLSISTIEGHLAFYVETSKITVEQLVDERKIDVIQNALNKMGKEALTPIKLALGDNFSFAEIRYVIAHLESQKLEEPCTPYANADVMSDVPVVEEPLIAYYKVKYAA